MRLLGDPPGKSSVNTELKVLERANLLARPSIEGDRRIDLVRQDSPWWEMCLGMHRRDLQEAGTPELRYAVGIHETARRAGFI